MIQRKRWVCLTCRKMFRPHYAHGPEAERMAVLPPPCCPNCKVAMRAVGRYFQPPRKQDVKQWRKVQLLLDAGYHFDGYQERPPKRLSEIAAFLKATTLR